MLWLRVVRHKEEHMKPKSVSMWALVPLLAALNATAQPAAAPGSGAASATARGSAAVRDRGQAARDAQDAVRASVAALDEAVREAEGKAQDASAREGGCCRTRFSACGYRGGGARGRSDAGGLQTARERTRDAADAVRNAFAKNH